MSKFKVNQDVYCPAKDKCGVVKAREVKTEGKRTEVKYLVDFGEGIENWKVMTKKDLKPVPEKGERSPWHLNEYKVGDGKIVTVAAIVETDKFYELFDDVWDEPISVPRKNRKLSIGFSIYNGTDEYNPLLGRKIAMHRAKTDPFAAMVSKFGGEFNRETVEAIMDVKAKYIIDHIDQFFRPE